MRDYKSAMNDIRHHGRILWKGLKRMMYGALTAGLFVLGIYGFAVINHENGWTAVCEFIVAMGALVMAIICMYRQGGGKRKKGGFEK